MRNLYLPLIIFWNAATGQPQAGVDFGGIPARSLAMNNPTVSFLSILAHSRLEAPHCQGRAGSAEGRREESRT
jgi:hypothetical protein